MREEGRRIRRRNLDGMPRSAPTHVPRSGLRTPVRPGVRMVSRKEIPASRRAVRPAAAAGTAPIGRNRAELEHLHPFSVGTVRASSASQVTMIDPVATPAAGSKVRPLAITPSMVTELSDRRSHRTRREAASRNARPPAPCATTTSNKAIARFVAHDRRQPLPRIRTGITKTAARRSAAITRSYSS